jgi:signal peptidase I, bacterial type
MKKVKKKQWIVFSVVTTLCLAFTIWVGNYWLLLLVPVIFDIYISKVVPWGAWKKSKNETVRRIAEWVDAILFALIAVYLINIFIFQNYKIPTSSLEKTLLVGDYLFVSKLSYGPRVPNTPLSFPLAQHTLPIVETKSYIEWPQWGYKRLKGTGHVKRNDIVVFNFPAGDTVALKAQNHDYHELVYKFGWTEVNSGNANFGEIVYRPVDRRENYVKRCIGVPGDSLQIIENQVYINGELSPMPEHAQLNYFVETRGQLFSDKQFRSLGVDPDDYKGQASLWVWSAESNDNLYKFIGIEKNERGEYNPIYRIPLTKQALTQLERLGWARSIHVEKASFFGGNYYPYGLETGWTRDNFGPLWIPNKGATIPLTPENIALYERCIVNYEGNTITQSGDKIYLNGVIANSYTFQYDYYFMMGDNRHNSQDSRSWGFVPEDHVVGKPILVWLSIDKDRGWFDGKIRWNRLFRNVSAD